MEVNSIEQRATGYGNLTIGVTWDLYRGYIQGATDQLAIDTSTIERLEKENEGLRKMIKVMGDDAHKRLETFRKENAELKETIRKYSEHLDKVRSLNAFNSLVGCRHKLYSLLAVAEKMANALIEIHLDQQSYLGVDEVKEFTKLKDTLKV